ncbi:MAG: hypothetical protein ACLP6E_13830 [Acidimicrobiales bacterium]|jgi:hypothetical protein
MSITKVIRYKTSADCAEQNARLIRAVFEELAMQAPEGLRYAAFRGDDGVTFFHVAVLDDEDVNPLLELPAFGSFVSGIGSRCEDAPVAYDASVVGSYRLLPDD